MSDYTIPLFPLNVVLFPASKLPLYIFEDRYKKMINDCHSEGSVFGVNFFSNNRIYNTGCTAIIERIVNTTATGEMNIICKGEKRYDLMKYELTGIGYFKGRINFLSDDNITDDKVLLEKTVSKYNELIKIVYKGSIKKLDLNELIWTDGTRSPAFLMAEKCGLNLDERQKLLEINEETERLEFVLKYLEEVMPKLKESERISGIIKSDGYIQQ